MISRLISFLRTGRHGHCSVISPSASGLSWLLLAGHTPQHAPIAEGRDLLALADGADHLELALQLHCTF